MWLRKLTRIQMTTAIILVLASYHNCNLVRFPPENMKIYSQIIPARRLMNLSRCMRMETFDEMKMFLSLWVVIKVSRLKAENFVSGLNKSKILIWDSNGNFILSRGQSNEKAVDRNCTKSPVCMKAQIGKLSLLLEMFDWMSTHTFNERSCWRWVNSTDLAC